MRLLLRPCGELSRPVALARRLVECGLSLRKAHDVLDRLAAGRACAVEVASDIGDLPCELRSFGIAAAEIRRPDLTVKAVRELHGLSQAEFALRFGLEVRTVQNWEQQRHGIDAGTSVLLALIREWPDAVDAVLTGVTRDSGASPDHIV